MGHDFTRVENFNSLLEFLDEKDIPTHVYQGYEYYVRFFLNGFSHLTKIPDEHFSEKIASPSDMLKYFSEFEKKNNLKWGFHALIPSGAAKEMVIDKRQILDEISIIENKLQPVSEIMGSKMKESLKKLRRQIEKEFSFIENLHNDEDYWKEQQHLYLLASKLIADAILSEDVSNMNDFILMKKNCYFPETTDKKERLRQELKDSPYLLEMRKKVDLFFQENQILRDFELLKTLMPIQRKSYQRKAS